MINQELINFANHLADLSSNIAHKYFRKEINEQKKHDDSPVTIADQEIEGILRKEISKKYPKHGIIAEEYKDINLDADFKWVIDPIDGTSSFIIGKPVFTTLISLTYKNKPILGLINQPINNERWLGIKDRKTIFNDSEVSVRKSGLVENSVLCTTSPVFFKGKNLEIFNKITAKTLYQEYGGVFYGGDSYLFGLMASGLMDIIIDTGLKNYDYCALIPIINGAGGIITDWQGKEVDINSSGQILACGDKKVHDQLLKIIDSVI